MATSSIGFSHSSLNVLSSEDQILESPSNQATIAIASESPVLPVAETESPGSVSNEVDNDSSSTMDSSNSVSASSNPGPETERTVRPSSAAAAAAAAAAGAHSRPAPVHRSRSFNHTHNQNQQRRFPSQQRGDGFNRRGGNREYGFQNHSNRRHQQQGFNHWNSGPGFNARAVNSPQWPHNFGNGPAGFLPPQPLPLPLPLPHSHPHWNAPPYGSELPPPPPPPGYMHPIGYYPDPYFPDAYNQLYSPVPVPVPVLAPHADVIRGPAFSPQPPLPHNFPSPEDLLCNDILKQIEYYFSYQNLQTDGYLKFQMDEQGWVPLGVIAGFPRIENRFAERLYKEFFLKILKPPMCKGCSNTISGIQLSSNSLRSSLQACITQIKIMTTDIQLIRRALQPSSVVEVLGEKLRKRGDWMTFIQPRHSLSTTQPPLLPDTLLSGIQNIQLNGRSGEEPPPAAASNIE